VGIVRYRLHFFDPQVFILVQVFLFLFCIVLIIIQVRVSIGFEFFYLFFQLLTHKPTNIDRKK